MVEEEWSEWSHQRGPLSVGEGRTPPLDGVPQGDRVVSGAAYPEVNLEQCSLSALKKITLSINWGKEYKQIISS